ncbi:protein tipE-like isoform X2 [Oratosquilla oratoria]|uniref:protein tipE-like isoform X2 n=1 Tax=Oratosquilla oratoria TaxID=337810 RepID=UPI003F75C2BF
MLVPTNQITRGAITAATSSEGGASTSTSSSKENLRGGNGKGNGKGSKAGSSTSSSGLKHQSSEDRERQETGRQALRELLKDRKKNKKQKTSVVQVLKVYATVLGGLMISGGLMVLLFLVPMTIDPALATLTYDINPESGICITTYARMAFGAKECTWCSCTEGCTKDIFNCSQITVSYNKTAEFERSTRSVTSGGGGVGEEALQEGDNGAGNAFGNKTWLYSSRSSSWSPDYEDVNGSVSNVRPRRTQYDDDDWDVNNASLYVNVKGCGYPPRVECETFYQNYGVPGRRFPCYYSRLDSSLVVPYYNPEMAWNDLESSLAWTCGAQAIGLLIIIVVHLPYKTYFRAIWRRRGVIQARILRGNEQTRAEPPARAYQISPETLS